ncbi:hypothetical protein MNBD_UNCLBAC01-78 [hydrothermal vent metagenome]|uniref:Lipopolysaccharide-assembly n=1 Tax=hydrothermal vent metagenome TaxID=652676 RepID=A0A3B1DID5_9ZZZZ
MFKRGSFFYVCWFSILTILTGCGYTTRSTLPKNLQTIHIEDFKNEISYTDGSGRNIYLPLLELDARNAVIDRFLFDGNLKIAEFEDADLILKGRLKSYFRGVLRYTDDQDVEEYRVQITVSFELWDTKRNEIAWSEPGFVGEAEYFVTGSQAITEEAAVKIAIKDLARRIVERTIEDW